MRGFRQVSEKWEKPRSSDSVLFLLPQLLLRSHDAEIDPGEGRMSNEENPELEVVGLRSEYCNLWNEII